MRCWSALHDFWKDDEGISKRWWSDFNRPLVSHPSPPPQKPPYHTKCGLLSFMIFLNFWAPKIFSDAMLFLDIMICPNCRAPPNFLDVLFFPEIMIFQNFRESPIFLHVAFFPDITIFPNFQAPPMLWMCHYFWISWFSEFRVLPSFRMCRFSPDCIFFQFPGPPFFWGVPFFSWDHA